LAVALGNAGWSVRTGAKSLPTLRCHFLPWANGRLLSDTASGKVLSSPDWVVSDNLDPASALIALVSRRIMLAEAGAERVLPLRAGPAGGANLADLCRLMDGEVDLRRVLLLARVVAAMDLTATVTLKSGSGEPPDDGWLAIRMALVRDPTGVGARVPADPAIVRRLAAGDVSAAVQIAQQRLGGAGLRLPLYTASTDAASARLWAAALAFPLSAVALRVAAARAFCLQSAPLSPQ